jgi:hypothetical protein
LFRSAQVPAIRFATSKRICPRVLAASPPTAAEGLWRDGNAKEKDDIIIVEVMVDDLDRDWWHDFRTRLERRLDQEELVVRAHGIEKL